MSLAEIQTTDAKARVTLPTAFANAEVVVEQLTATEIRVRRAKANGKRTHRFLEETATTLSDRDRERFLKLLAHPPKPNAALKKAVARHRARRG